MLQEGAGISSSLYCLPPLYEKEKTSVKDIGALGIV